MIQNKRADLAMSAANKYCKNLDNIKFIGITGTNGKSTTAIILKNILSDFGYKVGLIGTGKIIFENEILSDENYSMTTPAPEVLYSAIGKMEEMGAEIIVMEVSSHALDQERAFPINFHIGIFTNLSPEHLDYHKNIDNYFKAKCKLFQNSKHKIINVDDPYGKTLFKNIENADKKLFHILFICFTFQQKLFFLFIILFVYYIISEFVPNNTNPRFSRT